ncbi:MAG: tetratricopeptide repeat protein, partial [Acidobacteria bacterium]|nr:tetratricopeptide repeat protein [Acidobacteriota bacterium]
MVRRQHVPVLSLVALSGAALCFVGCASSTAVDANAQKKYGTEMAAKGFWREALFRYELAAKQAPGDAEVQNNLAVAYESLGETARALAHYRKALEISPENEKIKRNYARFAEYYTAVQRAAGATGPALAPAVPAV